MDNRVNGSGANEFMTGLVKIALLVLSSGGLGMSRFYAGNQVDFAIQGLATPEPAPQAPRAFVYDPAQRFATVHRIELAVTSSNFPAWDRNLNNGLSSFTGDS